MPDPITIDTITVADEPDAWRAAGFTVATDGECVIGTARVQLAGPGAGKRITGWTLRGARVGPDGLDGLPTTTSDAPMPEPSTHANGVELIDHIVLLTPDSQRTTAALEAAGFDVRRTRHTDQYGPPFLQTFFRAGEVIVELIGPEEPSGDGPAGFFGLAYTVADLDATKALLGDGLGEPKPAVQPGRRIATLRHKTFGISIGSAFMSPEPVDEPAAPDEVSSAPAGGA
jgi:hypothetical protein